MGAPGRNLFADESPAPAGRNLFSEEPPTPPTPPDPWQPTQYGFRVQDAVTPDTGKPTKLREDGYLYYGPDQGNTGRPGWFDAKGMRGPDVPVKTFAEVGTDRGLGIIDRLLNRQQEFRNRVAQQGVLKTAAQDLGNQSILPTAPGTLIRQIREGFGYRAPMAAESYLPDPTAARTVKGALDTVVAPAQLLGNAVSPGTVGPAVNQFVTNEQQWMDQNFRPSQTGEMLGQALPFVLTGGGTAAAQGSAKLLPTLAKSAGTGAVMAPLLTPEANVQSPSDYWGRKGKEAAVGAGLGVVVPSALLATQWMGDKTARALAGTKLGNLFGIATELNPAYQGAPQLADELAAKGIRTSPGDVTGDTAIRAVEDRLARNSPEYMRWRQDQNRETAAYADKVLGELKAAMTEGGWTNLDQIQAAAKSGGKRSGQAQALLTALENAGDDWREIVQQSGNAKLFLEKLRADANYDKVRALADAAGLTQVKPTETRSAVATALKQLKGNSAGDQGAKGFLSGIQKGIGDGPAASSVDHLGGGAAPTEVVSQDLSFEGMRRLRSSITTRIRDIQKGQVVASSDELPHLERLAKAIENDLGAFTKQNPEVYDAYRQAQTHYQTKVAPYKDPAYGKALSHEDPTAAARIFESQGNPANQRRFWGLLDAKGQAAVRYGLIDNALTAGEVTQRGVAGLDFSVPKAAAQLERLGKGGVMDIAFPGGEDRWAAKGLARILRTVDRSNAAGFIPPTGVTEQSIAAKPTLGDLVMKPLEWLNKQNMMRLYTDPKGRLLLQRASDLQPGTPGMKALVERDIPRFLGAEAKNVIPFDRTTAPSSVTPKAAQNAPE